MENVLNLSGMFSNCHKLEDIGDIGQWNFNVPNISIFSMFSECYNLKYIEDISGWNIQNINSINVMFYYCSALNDVGDLTKWKFNKKIDHKYAFDGSSLRYKYWNKRIIEK